MTATTGTFLVLALLIAAGCGHESDLQPRPLVRIGADSPQLGADLQRLYTTLLPNIDFTIEKNTGSISAVTAVGRGDADLGYARADVAYLAFHGMLDDASESFDRLRAVSQIGEVLLHVVRRPGAPIRSLHDLPGRPVAIGPPGSGVALLSRLVLAAAGIEQDTAILRSLPHETALAALLAGRLDAMFLSSGYPNSLVERAVLPVLARTYSVFRTLDLTHASATPIPLHEGASHYYREQELFR